MKRGEMVLLAIGVLVIGLFLWLGNRSSRLNLTGQWVGFRKMDAKEGADPSIVKTLTKVELRILPNRRFSLFERGLPKRGRVDYSEDRATLEITELAGKGMETQPEHVRDEYGPIEVIPQKDGSLLYRDPKLMEPPVFLRRSKV
ncbi:MAG: hypothetical protein ACAH95_06220 [Fimbriimonas sp.]